MKKSNFLKFNLNINGKNLAKSIKPLAGFKEAYKFYIKKIGE